METEPSSEMSVTLTLTTTIVVNIVAYF